MPAAQQIVDTLLENWFADRFSDWQIHRQSQRTQKALDAIDAYINSIPEWTFYEARRAHPNDPDKACLYVIQKTLAQYRALLTPFKNHRATLFSYVVAIENMLKEKLSLDDPPEFSNEMADDEMAKLMTSVNTSHGRVAEDRRPEMKTLKLNRVELDDDERKQVMRRGAVWHHGPKGKASPAVWKSEVRGKTYFVCNTHRAAAVKPTLKGAIRAFDFIKTTS
jgi:hypothetical protein